MEKKTKALLDSLLEAIEEDERYIELRLSETRMEEDEDVIRLSSSCKELAESWQEASRYQGENSKAALDAQKKLYEAKLALDNHPLVSDYRKKYAEIASIYRKMNDLIMGDFLEIRRCEK